MAGSTLDPDHLADLEKPRPPDDDVTKFGPSELSDTGSDTLGPGVSREDPLGLNEGKDPDPDAAPDIDVDREVGIEEAGLGSGLDQAEEALLGVTDEELEKAEEETAVTSWTKNVPP